MQHEIPEYSNMPGMKTYLHWDHEKGWRVYYVPQGYEVCFTCDGDGDIDGRICPECDGKCMVPESEV